MIATTKSGARAATSSAATVALCYLVTIFEGFDLQAAGVAAPRLGPAFHIPPEQMGWFFSASTFGLMLGAMIGGRLSDRFGRRPVLIACVAFFGLMSLATALASGIESLILARFLTGFGIGGALPNLVALVSENTTAERHGRSISFLYAGFPTGGASAALISLLGAPGDWRIVFLVGGMAPLLIIPLLLKALPASQAQVATHGAAEAAPPGRGFAYALLQEGRLAPTLLLWAGFFLALLTLFIILNWMPTLLVSRGLTRTEASLSQVAFNVMGVLTSVGTGFLLDRWGARKVALVFFPATAVALVALAYAPSQFGPSLVAGAAVGVTLAAIQCILYALAPTIYPTAVRGTGVGSAVAMGRFGSAVGPLIAGVLVGAGKSAQEVLAVLVPTILMSGVAVLWLTYKMPKDDA